ncbi:MAG: YihY/virulence factor BrkB family protein, partial [Gemmatimonadota bacterium]
MPFILLLLIALTYLAQLQGSSSPIDIHQLMQPFLPPHTLIGGNDPFAVVEGLLAKIAQNRDKLTLYAIPSFIWFSTRLFGGIRTALNHIYDVSVRTVRRHFLIAYLAAKLRDITMVMIVVALFLFNTVLGTFLTFIESRGANMDRLTNFFLSNIGRGLGELLTIAFSITLFFVVYRHAAIRRLSWKAALVAASFTAVAFELAKRLFGIYLANIVSNSQFTLDANLGAVILFVLWIWYTSVVFLLGGVVAETWDLR